MERYVYDPFGSVTVLDADWTEHPSNPPSNWTERSGGSQFAWVYLHQGGRFDDVSGLYHFRYRDYSSTLGRWTSLDPLRYEAGDVNLYRVVFNAPTVYVDPFGLDNDIPDAVAVPLPGPLLPVQNNLLPHISRRWQHLVQECDLIFDGESWQAVGGRGLLLGVKANVNAIATTARSLVTLGIWAEPWEVWAVDDADRPFYEGGFLAARFGWESLPTAGIGKLTQAPGQMGRWGRYALYWDAGQNVVPGRSRQL